MKYRILISTLVVALACLGGVAVADTTQPTQIVTGKVISSTPTQLVLEDEAGARTTFVVDASVVPSTVMVGDRISVSYQSQAGGSFRATNVAIATLASNEAMPANDPAYPSTAPASPTYPSTTSSLDTTTTDTSADNDALPATASKQPLILLLGLLAVGGFALRMVTRS
jgi:hypothetical protein